MRRNCKPIKIHELYKHGGAHKPMDISKSINSKQSISQRLCDKKQLIKMYENALEWFGWKLNKQSSNACVLNEPQIIRELELIQMCKCSIFVQFTMWWYQPTNQPTIHQCPFCPFTYQNWGRDWINCQHFNVSIILMEMASKMPFYWSD